MKNPKKKRGIDNVLKNVFDTTSLNAFILNFHHFSEKAQRFLY